MSEHMQLYLALCRIGLYTRESLQAGACVACGNEHGVVSPVPTGKTCYRESADQGAGLGSQAMIHGVTGLPLAAIRAQSDKCFRALCCKGPPPPRPEYDVVCIGLTGAGKTSLLSRLCSEGSDGIVPTTGFSIKAVPFPNAILNVKELGATHLSIRHRHALAALSQESGLSPDSDSLPFRRRKESAVGKASGVRSEPRRGADNIKKYWSRYYQGSQGVVFVLDSASSDEDLEAARNELHSALQHPQLCTLPFLILANHQDKPAARTTNQEKNPFRGNVEAAVQMVCDIAESAMTPHTRYARVLSDKLFGRHAVLSKLLSRFRMSRFIETGPFQLPFLKQWDELVGAILLFHTRSIRYLYVVALPSGFCSAASPALHRSCSPAHAKSCLPSLKRRREKNAPVPIVINGPPFVYWSSRVGRPAATSQNKTSEKPIQHIKKYFELEPLARGKRWILEGCSTDNMEAVKESFETGRRSLKIWVAGDSSELTSLTLIVKTEESLLLFP
ncbi:unnamed protein product [Menidia menidia]|uniref:(Atlantic silverside) hypothetical protein n=1 Tax=Menidia menidia TaxID=238744 RepID=A0A8S4BAY3_9TELE|nr:unnamed protein product [Menidia menidia]